MKPGYDMFKSLSVSQVYAWTCVGTHVPTYSRQCICAYMLVCILSVFRIHIYTSIRMCACMYTLLYMYTRVHLRMYVCMHACMYVCTYGCVYVGMYA